jgi:hypothetical protein
VGPRRGGQLHVVASCACDVVVSQPRWTGDRIEVGTLETGVGGVLDSAYRLGHPLFLRKLFVADTYLLQVQFEDTREKFNSGINITVYSCLRRGQ